MAHHPSITLGDTDPMEPSSGLAETLNIFLFALLLLGELRSSANPTSNCLSKGTSGRVTDCAPHSSVFKLGSSHEAALPAGADVLVGLCIFAPCATCSQMHLVLMNCSCAVAACCWPPLSNGAESATALMAVD